MNPFFFFALVAQTLCALAFMIHRFVKPLGSEPMFGVLLLSLFLGVYLQWQSLRNPSIVGIQKILGIVLGFLPLVWLLLFVAFLGNTQM
jgi:hypothetical protein